MVGDLQAAAEAILVHEDFGCGEQHCSEHGSAREGSQALSLPHRCTAHWAVTPVLHPEIPGTLQTGHISFGAPTL